MKSIRRSLVMLALTLSPILPLSPSLFAQPVAPEWVLRKGGRVPNSNGEAWGIEAGSDGSIYWSTNQSGPRILSGLDVVVYRLDAAGNETWTKPLIFEGDYAQQSYAAKVSGDTLFVTGRNCRSNSINLELCDMMLLAIDARTGDTLWTRVWDNGYGYEEGDGIVPAHDGVILTGWATGETSDWDAGLVKFSRSGEKLWGHTWGTQRTDHQDGHVVADDSVIYAAGLYSGSTNPIIAFKGFDGKSHLTKFKRSDGSYMAHVTYGRDDTWANFENALGMTSDGTYLYVVGITTVATNNHALFVKKFDKNLNEIWSDIWNTDGTESARAAAIGPDGTLYVAASSDGTGANGYDVAIVAYTPGGERRSVHTWGGAADDHAYDMIHNNGALYITGKTNSFTGNALTEGFLIKVPVSALSSVEAIDAADARLALHANRPDPFRYSTTISCTLPSPGHITLTIHNALGEEVARLADEQLEAGKHSFEWRADRLPAGRYFCRMVADGKVITEGMSRL